MDTMQTTIKFLESRGFPGRDAYDLPSSTKRFPDGAQFRIEIPSVEGPEVFAETIKHAQMEGVVVHRISQGSGVMMLKREELKRLAKMGKEEGIEVCLFVGPRSTWDIGAFNRTVQGQVLGYRHRGMDQLVYALEDIRRGCDAGIRSFLVADEGLLWAANEMRKEGLLPKDMILKVSIRMAHGNPVALKLVQDMGADTINIIGDLTLPQLAAIRQAIDIPIDMYVEHADAFGAIARYYEIPEIIRVAAPIYLKIGSMNTPGIYPSGKHLEETAKKITIERCRRARVTMEIIKEYYPEAIMSEKGAPGLGIPVAD